MLDWFTIIPTHEFCIKVPSQIVFPTQVDSKINLF